MLTLTRKENEKIVILGSNHETIIINVNKIDSNQVSIGVSAPKSCRIYRDEIFNKNN